MPNTDNTQTSLEKELEEINEKIDALHETLSLLYDQREDLTVQIRLYETNTGTSNVSIRQ